MKTHHRNQGTKWVYESKNRGKKKKKCLKLYGSMNFTKLSPQVLKKNLSPRGLVVGFPIVAALGLARVSRAYVMASGGCLAWGHRIFGPETTSQIPDFGDTTNESLIVFKYVPKKMRHATLMDLDGYVFGIFWLCVCRTRMDVNLIGSLNRSLKNCRKTPGIKDIR